MTEDEYHDAIIILSEVTHEESVCPFSQGRWKKAGDALVFFMLFIAPVLFLISLILTSFY